MDGPSCDSSDDDHPTALDAEVGVVHPINLSDPGAEEALYDIQSMRTFCGLELGRDAIPDETTILNFRHLLECHDLTKAVFAAVAEHLEARGALLRGGTIVDATLIAASPSTKNRAGKRDPEMRSSKKGNQWYFGMKTHVGVDAKSGLVHTAGVTTGSVHDAKVMPRLIREDDRAVYGDKGYASDERKRAAEKAGVKWAVKEKAQPGRKVDGPAACPQSQVRQGARESRALVPRHQMPVRLPQGALSRHRQERCADVLAAGAR
jgi:IS5 family transposase